MAINKPDFDYLWASGGAVVEPSDAKKQAGWVSEVPPHQWENWVQNRQDTMLAHINERGIPQWDSSTEYLANRSYVTGSSGTIFRCLITHTNINPETDSSGYWEVWLGDISELAEGALQKSDNLSDLSNISTAHSNLGLGNMATQVAGTGEDQFRTNSQNDSRFARLSASNNFTEMPSVGGDPIVESGSNSDGEWTRFSSGLVIMTGTSSGATGLSATGSVYRSDLESSDLPTILDTNYSSWVGVRSTSSERWANATVVSDSSISWREWTYFSSSSSFAVYWTVIGRWK